MVEYDTIDMSEGTYVNKTIGSSECIVCHYWFLLEINFRFELNVYDGCHDLMEKAMSFNEAVIVFVKGNDYIILFFVY